MPGILEIRERPRLRRPVLIAGFSGWGNGGQASAGAIDYLLGDPKPEPIAFADPDLCFDFTVARPTTSRGGRDGWRLTYPRFAVYTVARPDAPRDLMLVQGPEPNFRWAALSSAVATLAEDCGVEAGFPLGAFIGAVSHKRASLGRRTLNTALGEALAELGAAETQYEGPTAFQSALLHALHDHGIPAASIWVASAPYVQGRNPRAVLALLSAVNKVADIGIDLGRLRAETADWTRQLDGILKNRPELASQLRQMVDLDEAWTKAEDESPAQRGADTGELPSGASLVEELERYLRQSQRPGAEEPESN